MVSCITRQKPSMRQLTHTGRWRQWQASSSGELYVMTQRFMVE